MSELDIDIEDVKVKKYNPFCCPKCSRKFKNRKALCCHFYRSGCSVSVKPARQCQDCHKKFDEEYDLILHQAKSCLSSKEDLVKDSFKYFCVFQIMKIHKIIHITYH